MEVYDELSTFIDSGIYRLGDLNTVFIDPVRILNNFYTRFRVSPSLYYSRFSKSYGRIGKGDEDKTVSSSNLKKRKRKKHKPYDLNERELSAEKRHQEARPFLLKAHEAFLGATDLLLVIHGIIRDKESSHAGKDEPEKNFVELGSIWQAPLYEISLRYLEECRTSKEEDAWLSQCSRTNALPLFNNIVSNETNGDVEAEFLNNRYILPKKSRFHMSDLRQICNLITALPHAGFNLIVIDPPWENGSAFQKLLYPTLPNQHFLYLPVKQLAHKEGALVALWVTNREKLRVFVEDELFPAWGVMNVAQCYWLKVKADGSLIGELDLFHHRPYENLLLGYIGGKGDGSGSTTATHRHPQNNQVFISIPGAYSRKPPVGTLLLDYTPGPKPANCIELFARELVAGWTSWGNEPLHFQDARYFLERDAEATAD